MDKGCAVIHLLLAHLQADAWWEYAQSDSNWSDGASREGEQDPWINKMKFEVMNCRMPQWPWVAEAEERTARIQQVLGKAALG